MSIQEIKDRNRIAQENLVGAVKKQVKCIKKLNTNINQAQTLLDQFITE